MLLDVAVHVQTVSSSIATASRLAAVALASAPVPTARILPPRVVSMVSVLEPFEISWLVILVPLLGAKRKEQRLVSQAISFATVSSRGASSSTANAFKRARYATMHACVYRVSIQKRRVTSEDGES